MGIGLSKKIDVINQERQRNNKSAESRMKQLERRMEVFDENMRYKLQKMKNKQVKANSRIDTLENAEIALGTNLRSLSDKVDSLTNCMEIFKSEVEESLIRFDRLMTLMANSEETKLEEMNLISSFLLNINQFGQAPVNLNFVNIADQDDTDSDEE